MNAINEAELTDFVKNKVVKRLHIVQNEAGRYEIIVNLTWKKGDLNLVTTRGKNRDWVSLDRLARHIQEKYEGTLPPISLTLYKKTQ